MKIACPLCKKEFSLILDEKAGNSLKEVKGAHWHPLLKQTGPTEWIESWKNGIAVDCGCGRAFFVNGLSGGTDIVASTTLESGNSVAWFCEKCGSAFIDSSMKCPSCGAQY